MAFEEDLGNNKANNVVDLDPKSTSNVILRVVNISRIILFGIAAVVQMSASLYCYFLSYNNCNVFNALVPLLLLFVDAMIIRLSRDPIPQYLLVRLIVCFIAMGAVFFTVFPMMLFPTLVGLDGRIILFLGVGVGLVSLSEMMTLIYLTRPQEQKKEDVWGGPDRTFDGLWENGDE
ncbi:MAG: hypothetical protein RTU63_09310 [Candidatus Thorarchaeota archaeon]